ncbi:hypothetical protein C4572_02870, partial [Candidatus Parcubacteria bacterium]
MFKKIKKIKFNELPRIWRRRLVIFLFLIVLIFMVSGFLFWLEYTGRDEAMAYKYKELSIINYLPKILDVYFLPLMFGKSQLPGYEIVIDKNKLDELYKETDIGYCCNCLPEEADKYINAQFIFEGKSYPASIKPRGDCSNHWGYEKKSWRIKFDDEALFSGEKQLDLIIPSDREFVAEYLNNYRAKKFGLVVPEMKFVELKINGI